MNTLVIFQFAVLFVMSGVMAALSMWWETAYAPTGGRRRRGRVGRRQGGGAAAARASAAGAPSRGRHADASPSWPHPVRLPNPFHCRRHGHQPLLVPADQRQVPRAGALRPQLVHHGARRCLGGGGAQCSLQEAGLGCWLPGRQRARCCGRVPKAGPCSPRQPLPPARPPRFHPSPRAPPPPAAALHHPAGQPHPHQPVRHPRGRQGLPVLTAAQRGPQDVPPGHRHALRVPHNAAERGAGAGAGSFLWGRGRGLGGWGEGGVQADSVGRLGRQRTLTHPAPGLSCTRPRLPLRRCNTC
jgi:hypothetical protein